MKLGQLLLALTLVMIMSPVKLVATTIDGSINLSERPSISLDEALSKANEALGREAGKFVCTEAKSINRSSGGGWRFFFRSSTLNTRAVEIDMSGKVVADNDAAPKGGQFKSAPSLSIEKAIAIALATRGKTRRWFCVDADWREKPDEWGVSLVTARREMVFIYVDSKGKTREQKALKQ